MTDPWDDAGRSQAGFVVTAAGLRVPVAAPTSLAGWPATSETATTAAPNPTGTEARYRGVGPRGYQRADARVREQVCERLLLDPYLDASGIVVQVSKGRVVLTGIVPSERMRDAAIAAASSVSAGSVDARLQVAGRPSRRSTNAAVGRTRPTKKPGRSRKGAGSRKGGGQR
jgi:osmotically-inducible protein OsmY